MAGVRHRHAEAVKSKKRAKHEAHRIGASFFDFSRTIGRNSCHFDRRGAAILASGIAWPAPDYKLLPANQAVLKAA